MVIDEVGALEAAIVAGGLVEDKYVRLDALVLDQPRQVGDRPKAVSATRGSGQMSKRSCVRSIFLRCAVTSACSTDVAASTSTITA